MSRPTPLDRDYHRPARLPSCVTPVNTLAAPDRVDRYAVILEPVNGHSDDGFRVLALLDWLGRFFAGTGISTRCPSTTPVGLALGPDLPRADYPGPGTLGLPE